MNSTTGAEVWHTTDGTTWTQVSLDGLGSANTFAAELIPFNGYLYVWTSNDTTGQQVLRTQCLIRESQTIAGTGTYSFSSVGAAI